jgi:Flagellar basal body L-ring protein
MKHAAKAFGLLLGAALCAHAAKKKEPEPSPIEQYIRQAEAMQAALPSSAGSLYSSNGILSDLTRDVRAFRVGDIVTILVSDRASAIARGKTSTNRQSSVNSSVGALAGPTGPALSGLASASTATQLQGQGETSRETVLTTTLSARVTHVLPNGYLVVEGNKDIAINSERQQIQVRGVLRWNDLSPANVVRSDRLAELEIRINGKGVVGDAIRQPNFLYRLLLGLLPF